MQSWKPTIIAAVLATVVSSVSALSYSHHHSRQHQHHEHRHVVMQYGGNVIMPRQVPVYHYQDRPVMPARRMYADSTYQPLYATLVDGEGWWCSAEESYIKWTDPRCNPWRNSFGG